MNNDSRNERGLIPFVTTSRGVKVRVLETGTIQVGRGSMPDSEDSPMADAVYSLAAPGGGKLINVPASRRAELVAVIGDWYVSLPPGTTRG